ncbi:MAG: hypothetical protein Tsb0020_24910 [Haliangiales bacterium]
MLPPQKTALPAVVMRKADGTAAPPLPFTGIPADLAAWAFQPHMPMAAPQTPIQARGDISGPSVHEAAAAGVRDSGSALPHAERIQAAFGPAHDIRHVRAHVGGAAAVSSEAIGAEAYATGNHIAFRDAPDVHTAAHEAAHVIQQQQGVMLLGGVGQAGDVYERHADAVADRVVAGQSAEDLLAAGPTGGAQSTTVIGSATAAAQDFLNGPADTNASLQKNAVIFSGTPCVQRSKSPALLKAEARLSKLNDELALELAISAADIAGLADPTPISDGISMALSLAKGDWLGASLSLVSMVPYFGDAAGKSAKAAKNAKRIASLRNQIETAMETVKRLSKKTDPLPNEKVRSSIAKELDHALGKTGKRTMLGANGTKTPSKTLWKGKGKERIDVENPSPGQRPGQIHYQDNKNNKYLYDPETKSFPGAPNSVNKKLEDPAFKAAIEKAMTKYLGEAP